MSNDRTGYQRTVHVERKKMRGRGSRGIGLGYGGPNIFD